MAGDRARPSEEEQGDGQAGREGGPYHRWGTGPGSLARHHSHAITFAREGAEVVVRDNAEGLPTVPYPLASPGDLADTARMVEEFDRRCLAVRADVRDSRGMRRVFERAVSELGRVDVLVANARIESFGRVWGLTNDEWDEMLDVTLTGAGKNCRAVIPHMIERRSGVVLITSPIAGPKGLANQAHYCAA